MSDKTCEICGDTLTTWEAKELSQDLRGHLLCVPCVRSTEQRARFGKRVPFLEIGPPPKPRRRGR